MLPPIEHFLASHRRVVVLGIGAEDQGDDAVGPLIVNEVLRIGASDLFAVHGGTTPEAATGEIRKLTPDGVMIIDAAEMGATAGEIAVVEAEKIREKRLGLTHRFPLALLVRYLRESIPCDVLFVGVQPATLDVAPMTPEVRERAVEFASQLCSLRKHGD